MAASDWSLEKVRRPMGYSDFLPCSIKVHVPEGSSMPPELQITATCYTAHDGVHKIKLSIAKGAQLPDSISVMVPVEENIVRKFDPRLNWDIWAKGEIDPSQRAVVVKHFAGTVYIDQSLPFMRKAPKIEGAIAERIVDDRYTLPSHMNYLYEPIMSVGGGGGGGSAGYPSGLSGAAGGLGGAGGSGKFMNYAFHYEENGAPGHSHVVKVYDA